MPRLALPISLPIPLQRQLARSAPRARRHSLFPSHSGTCTGATSPSYRSFTTSFSPSAPKRPLLPLHSPPTHTSPALAALLSRLSLPTLSNLQTNLQACLTHPSYRPNGENNELLSALGNSLLGLYASEHLASLYPYLPTDPLQRAVTAYVGPGACVSVARSLGVSVVQPAVEVEDDTNVDKSIRRARRRASLSLASDTGVAIRWNKQVADKNAAEANPVKLPVARRFRRHLEAESESGQGKVGEVESAGVELAPRGERWEDVVAGVVKAFVGLIYQEQGMHAARTFVNAHFLSRHLDMTTLFTFRNPKHVLSRAIAKHLEDRGVGESEGQAKVESRLLAETGRLTQQPIYSIGLFLPSGLKLAEGHGSSIAMAEHRAAVNALYSLYLVKAPAPAPVDASESTLVPTSAHGQWAVEAGKVGRGVGYVAPAGVGMGGNEGVVETGRRAVGV